MGRLCYALIIKAVLSYALDTAFSAFPTNPRGTSRPAALFAGSSSGGRRVPGIIVGILWKENVP